ncbi:MAG: hypothetical protein M0Z48_03170 [Nitrospiraceae bacterium]|nr:hypothetical protein [Nitrospiraceae bacterium]
MPAHAGYKLTLLLTLTVLSLLIAAGGAFAAPYYVSPGGSDSAAGTSSSPWGTFSHAMAVIKAGDTLYLEDGTYSQQLNIGVSGTSSAYVTVKALNDGGATVSTTYPTSPLLIGNRSYIEVDGINFSNSGVYDSNTYCATDGVGYNNVNGINIYGADHIILRRDIASGSSGCNSAVIGLAGVSNSLLEDCAGAGQGRVVLNMNSCSNVTIRRCWLDWTGPSTGGGDVANITQVYDSSNILMENNIGVNYTGESIEFFNTWAHYGSISGNGFYGNVAINKTSTAAGGMFMDSAECGESVSGTVFSNNVAIVLGGGQAAMEMNAAPNDGTVFSNNTFVSPNNSGGGLLLSYRSSCPGQSAAVADVSSNSFLGTWSGISGDSGVSNYVKAHDYNNYYDMYGGSPLYATQYINPPNMTANEAQMNPGYPTSTYGYGAYLMAPSALKGKGASGSDIGADVIYEYVNGSLTATPLWPWPMEGRIVAEFGVSPTYADDGNGHTGGIWTTLNGIPTRTGDSSSGSSMLAPPVPVSPTNGATTGTTVTFEWKAPNNNGLHYMLQLSKNGQFTDSTNITVASASTSAKNNTYAGLASIFLFGIVFSSGFGGRKKLLLLLAAIALSAMFLASCGGGGGGSSSPAGSAGASTGAAGVASYTVSGLTDNTTYYWKVIAADNTGQQAASPASSFVTN